MAIYPNAPGNRLIKKTIAAKKRVLTVPNKITDLASPNTPRTTKVGTKNSNGPKGGSSKSTTKGSGTTKDVTRAKAPKVTAAKLNTTKKTPFNRSSRVNYRQLKRSK